NERGAGERGFTFKPQSTLQTKGAKKKFLNLLPPRHISTLPESGHPIFHAALGWRDQTATRYDLRNTDVRWRTHSSAGKLLSSGLQSVAEFDCDLQAV